MKKRIAVVGLFLLYCLSSIAMPCLHTFGMETGAAYAEQLINAQASAFVLPSSLQEIEEEAFAGTAVQTVVFPENLGSVGDYAFKDDTLLRDAYIPDATKHIADSAFSSSTDMTIHGVEGSYAQEWAKEHRIAFVADDIWKLALDNGVNANVKHEAIDSFNYTIDPDKAAGNPAGTQGGNESRRPQDRPELNPIDYRFP